MYNLPASKVLDNLSSATKLQRWSVNTSLVISVSTFSSPLLTFQEKKSGSDCLYDHPKLHPSDKIASDRGDTSPRVAILIQKFSVLLFLVSRFVNKTFIRRHTTEISATNWRQFVLKWILIFLLSTGNMIMVVENSKVKLCSILGSKWLARNRKSWRPLGSKCLALIELKDCMYGTMKVWFKLAGYFML